MSTSPTPAERKRRRFSAAMPAVLASRRRRRREEAREEEEVNRGVHDAMRANIHLRGVLMSKAGSFTLHRHSLGALTKEGARRLYARDQILWLRLDEGGRRRCAAFDSKSLRRQFKRRPSFFGNHFHVENPGSHDAAKLTPFEAYGRKAPPSGPFYVSSILQDDEACSEAFLASVPYATHPLFQHAHHDDGVWLFYGSTGEGGATLPGRPEHVDSVDHSGTWHVQLRGSKTWNLRPCLEATEWGGAGEGMGGRGTGAPQLDGGRLRVEVREGDMLLVNTRAWYHKTDIEPQGVSSVNPHALSVSYARDFYLPGAGGGAQYDVGSEGDGGEGAGGSSFQYGGHSGSGGGGGRCGSEAIKTNSAASIDPRLFAATDIDEGQVALEEDDLPDTVPRSHEPNTELCVAEVDGVEMVVLLALRFICKGEPLSVALEVGEEGEYEEYELDLVTGEMVAVKD